jgi:hypothetical protein
MCKGFTFVSSTSTGKGDLKPLKVSSFPLSSLAISWRTPRYFSFSAPLNLARGDYNHDEIDGSRDGKGACVN